MRHRHRREHERRSQSSPAGEALEGGHLEAEQAQAGALLQAGNQIIDAALSGDSQAFLAANRQESGQ